ncbi:MAG: SWIM zinc finger family protein [Deltaproteobacteria bacterium]|nr:SWIM zinc finger family protein [Deltaproteobacteria bacterium]
MEFDFAYRGSSSVTSTAEASGLSFSPDLSRPPTYFRGQIGKALEFREAISALHGVVVSDLRYKPKDREAYRRWLADNEEALLAEMIAETSTLKGKVQALRLELDRLESESRRRMKPFFDARQRYFHYLYRRDLDTWYVLDPVITVHPDQIFFECFSQDESTYGRLSASYEVFKRVGDHACGTTNIDYSERLYQEFQKIRTYKETSLEIDPGGFEVDVENEPNYREVKIDLPDSWVRGFLQVSSAMTFPAIEIELHPFDVYNLCFVLRRRRELFGPRSIRFFLRPGEPVSAHLDPWGIEVPCPRSVYKGRQTHEVRLWGRRRLHILERLIPLAKRFSVRLLGTGMPSFWQADLGDMTFTLGLSGWTANDWSQAGNFDLLAPRGDVDAHTATRVFEALKATYFARPDELAQKLGLERSTVLAALAVYTQAGRVICDLETDVYRCRELARDPLPIAALRFANARETAAVGLIESGRIVLEGVDEIGRDVQVRGRLKSAGRSDDRDVVILIDADDRLTQAQCTCNFFAQNRLRKGPCEHMLGVRGLYERKRRERVERGGH